MGNGDIVENPTPEIDDETPEEEGLKFYYACLKVPWNIVERYGLQSLMDEGEDYIKADLSSLVVPPETMTMAYPIADFLRSIQHKTNTVILPGDRVGVNIADVANGLPSVVVPAIVVGLRTRYEVEGG